MSGSEHNKIIKKAASEILVPLGVFQIGQSRCWIDDRNWYLIQVEFQPSAWGKGAYLNVGISFLWEKSDALNETLSFDVGYRAHKHIGFSGQEESFYEDMLRLAHLAKEKILDYRRFDDLAFCKKELKKMAIEDDALWNNWNMAMFCFFTEEISEGVHYLEKVIRDCEESKIDWVNQMLMKGKRLLAEQDTLTQHALNSMNRRKEYFRQKSSYRKLKAFDPSDIKT